MSCKNSAEMLGFALGIHLLSLKLDALLDPLIAGRALRRGYFTIPHVCPVVNSRATQPPPESKNEAAMIGLGCKPSLPGIFTVQLAPASAVAIIDPAAVHNHACVESKTNMSVIGDAINDFAVSGTGVQVQLTPSVVAPVYSTPWSPPAIACD